MLSLKFWSSYFSKYFQLIVATKSNHQRYSINKAIPKFCNVQRKTPALESLFNKVATSLRRDSNTSVFSVGITNFLRTPILKTSANGCVYVTLLFYLPALSKLLHNYSFLQHWNPLPLPFPREPPHISGYPLFLKQI